VTPEINMQLHLAAPGARSSNVELDTFEVVGRYALTERAIDLLRRVADTFGTARASRAWAVTGPYGTGKSSLALLLAALLTPEDRSGVEHQNALEIVRGVDPSLAAAFEREALSKPALRALVTAGLEPVTTTVARALQLAASRRWPTGHEPIEVARALGAMAEAPDAPRRVMDAARELSKHAPVLIVLDEFGKNLEFYADQPGSSGDLQLLQDLAELASADRSGRLYLLTFQHAGFLDYIAQASPMQRRDWAKVQGRFSDITFRHDAADTAAIISAAIEHDDSGSTNTRLREYGQAAAAHWRARGLTALLDADPQLLAAVYPVHPVALAALPRICALLGQHDRTLTGLLGSDEPHTVRRLLEQPPTATLPHLPTYGLADVYDYFATAVRSQTLASSASGRWLQIETQVEAAAHMSRHDQDVLKSVGVLNLCATGGPLRASAENVAFAMVAPEVYGQDVLESTHAALDRLVGASHLTYREHADEYRVWMGSDFDIPAHLDRARSELDDAQVARHLAERHAPAAVVAGRHSQTTGYLRQFACRLSVTGDALTLDDLGRQVDGAVVFHLGDPSTPPSTEWDRPVLVGTTPHAHHVLARGREALALEQLLGDPSVDPVARAELRERLAVASAALSAELTQAFDPDRDDVVWELRLGDGTHESADPAAKTLSALTSGAADRAYPYSPEIANEMLGRDQLTSQGAKARRVLLAHLITATERPDAGIEGYGPEKAMYRGVVAKLGLHGRLPAAAGAPDAAQVSGWTSPEPGTNAHRAVAALRGMIITSPAGVTLAELEHVLCSPPYGVKRGVTPLLLVAALALTDDAALFEEGSFVRRMTPDLLERLTKAPERFSVRYSPSRGGLRGQVLVDIAQHVVPAARAGRRQNPASLVAVVSRLLDLVRGLPRFTLRTHTLSEQARALRNALSEATDPGALLFDQLPAAVGHAPVPPDAPEDAEQARQVAAAIHTAVAELNDAFALLRGRVTATFARVATGDPALPLRETRERFALMCDRLPPLPDGHEAKTLALHGASRTQDDSDWLNQLALVTVGSSLPEWDDTDAAQFDLRITAQVGMLQRLDALHFGHQRGAADARRLTLTRTDGSEISFVASLAEDLAPQIDARARDVAAEVESSYGPDGVRQLLLALTELTAMTTTSRTEPTPAQEGLR
jgi:hypothetical protein